MVMYDYFSEGRKKASSIEKFSIEIIFYLLSILSLVLHLKEVFKADELYHMSWKRYGKGQLLDDLTIEKSKQFVSKVIKREEMKEIGSREFSSNSKSMNKNKAL